MTGVAGHNPADHTAGRQDQLIFDIYNIYRLVLSLILLVSFMFRLPNSVLGAYNPTLYLQVTGFYVLLNLLVFFRGILPRGKTFDSQNFIAICVVDILVLVLISYSCGGVTSGVAHLLLVPVAAGSILVPGRLSVFLAAVGSIAVIYSEIYLYLTVFSGNDYYVQAGLLGLTLFITTLALQVLGERIRARELVTERQAARIQSLQEMNDRIIQRMHTGIIVVDSRSRIVTANSAACHMVLQDRKDELENTRLPEVLEQQLLDWKQNPDFKAPPVQISNTTLQIQATFAYLEPSGDANVLIFLEDYTRLASRMQQLKLMSLGRLTASIAHEVRNPLGAISHASQLLTETDGISDNDRRLLEIIIDHSNRVNAIIENVMQLSRNKGDMPELLDIGPWLRQFSEKFANSYSQPVNIDIDVESEALQIRTNPTQLEQLMTNLCDNGLRYSMANTGNPRVEIRARVDPVHNTPYLDIIDEGRGVAPEDEEKIFEPFYTTESRGTGLGLYICREICEANQASLTYSRIASGKSCFRITFAQPEQHIV